MQLHAPRQGLLFDPGPVAPAADTLIPRPSPGPARPTVPRRRPDHGRDRDAPNPHVQDGHGRELGTAALIAAWLLLACLAA